MKTTIILCTTILTLLLLSSCSSTPSVLSGGEPTVMETPKAEPSPTLEPSPSPSTEPCAPAEERIRMDVMSRKPSAVRYEETELTDELWNIIRKLNAFDSLEFIAENEPINIGKYTLAPFYIDKILPKTTADYSANQEEYDRLSEKYNQKYDQYAETSVVDACFADIFSKDADGIIPEYRTSEDCIEDGTLIGWNTTGADVSFDYILREFNAEENMIEMSFSTIMIQSPDAYSDGSLKPYDSPVYGITSWEEIAQVEDGIMVISAENLDRLRIVKYTFVLEDGKYKIRSIKLTEKSA